MEGREKKSDNIDLASRVGYEFMRLDILEREELNPEKIRS